MKKQHKRIISFVTTMALVFGSFSAPSLSYGAQGIDQTSSQSTGTQVTLTDIGGHWGEKAIQSAVNAGFVKGYEDQTFKPNRAVTRAEFVSMINKALQLRDTNTVNLLFQDVKESAWYYKDVQKAIYAKYIKGVNDTSFLPNNNITRQEAASMMASFLPKVGYQDETALAKYPDADKISSWAKPALAVTLNKAYLTGRNNGELSPKQSLTRAEAAKIIGLVLEKETIVREDISLTKANDSLKDKIFVGEVTIEKSVGEGDVLLENLTALSKITVLGGGVNTVTMKNAKIIRMIVAKEDTKVRVLATGDTNIFESYVFNDNVVVDSQGKTAIPGKGGYDSMVYVAGKVTAEKARSIVNQFAEKMDNRGKIITEQIGNVSAGSTISLDNDGRVIVSYPETVKPPTTGSKSKGGGTTAPTPDPTPDGNVTTTTCSCGIPLTSTGAFTKIVTFDADGQVGGEQITGYAIENPAQLQHLALDKHLGDTVVMMNDLDFTTIEFGVDSETPMEALKTASDPAIAGMNYTGHSPDSFKYGKFIPIGSGVGTNMYSGKFYGNNKTIKGLIVSGSAIEIENVGLFGMVSGASIQDLKLSGGSVSGNYLVGGVVGNAVSGSILNNCSNTGAVSGDYLVGGVVGNGANLTLNNCFNTGAVSGPQCVGGLVGKTEDSTVSACSNTGAVSGSQNLGGVVGNAMSGSILNNCSNTGAVSGYALLGGVVGVSSLSTVSNCSNTGAVYGSDRVGGVVGIAVSDSILNNCSNTGAVSGETVVGGVVSSVEDSSTVSKCFNTGAVSGSNGVGGVVGNAVSGSTVSKCFNTGAVYGSNWVGGVVGGLNNGEVKDCHWLQGVNLKENKDVGGWSGITTVSGITTFSAIHTSTLDAIYASMSAIASSAGAVGYTENGAGGITNMTFNINDQPLTEFDMLPITFSALQGSYIATNGSLTLSAVKVDPNTTIKVTTGTSLGGLLAGGGNEVAPAIQGDTFTYGFSSTNTWILIKAEHATNPKLNRVYTIYYRGLMQDV